LGGQALCTLDVRGKEIIIASHQERAASAMMLLPTK